MSTELAKYTHQDVRNLLERHEEKIRAVAGAAMSPARVMQLATLCCYQTPRLLQCDQASFLASVIQSCSLGIDLSPSSGEGYLIPRRNKHTGTMQACFQIGYQGLVKLACESGKVNFVHAHVVHAHDDFEWAWESDRMSELQYIHRLPRNGVRGHIVYVYAVAKLATGDLLGECLTVEDVEHVRDCSGARRRHVGRPLGGDGEEDVRAATLQMAAQDAQVHRGIGDDRRGLRLPA